MTISGKAKLTGALTDSVTSSPSHPAGVGNLPFEAEITYAARTGTQCMDLTSPGAFVALAGIDDVAGPVKNCTLLYFRSDKAMDVRITQKQSGGGTSTRTIESVMGIYGLEVAVAEAITKVEVQGPSAGAAALEWSGFGT